MRSRWFSMTVSMSLWAPGISSMTPSSLPPLGLFREARGRRRRRRGGRRHRNLSIGHGVPAHTEPAGRYTGAREHSHRALAARRSRACEPRLINTRPSQIGTDPEEWFAPGEDFFAEWGLRHLLIRRPSRRLCGRVPSATFSHGRRVRPPEFPRQCDPLRRRQEITFTTSCATCEVAY